MATRGQVGTICHAKSAGFVETTSRADQDIIVLGGPSKLTHSTGWNIDVYAAKTHLYRADNSVPVETFDTNDWDSITRRLRELFPESEESED